MRSSTGWAIAGAVGSGLGLAGLAYVLRPRDLSAASAGSTLDAAPAGPPSPPSPPVTPVSSAAGLLLAAVRAGTAELPNTVEIPLSSGLLVRVMIDAIRAPIEGADHLVRFPTSYQDQIAICNAVGCLPVTQEVSDLAWHNAPVHLAPIALPPTAEMGSVAWVLHHDKDINNPANNSSKAPLVPGTWIADPGKDWILSVRIAERTNGTGAVNYGWRLLSGKPLQPVGGTHDWLHEDYSQVCRLMRRTGVYKGETVELLDRPELWLPPAFPASILAPFRAAA